MQFEMVDFYRDGLPGASCSKWKPNAIVLCFTHISRFFSQRKEQPAQIPVCKNTFFSVLTQCVSHLFFLLFFSRMGTIIRIEVFASLTKLKVGWTKYSSNMIPPHVVKWIESRAVPAPCTAPRWIWLHEASPPRGQMRVQTGGDVIKRQIPHWLH